MLDFKLMELFGDGRVTAWGVYGFRVVPHVGEHIEVQRAGQAQVYVVRAVVHRSGAKEVVGALIVQHGAVARDFHTTR